MQPPHAATTTHIMIPRGHIMTTRNAIPYGTRRHIMTTRDTISFGRHIMTTRDAIPYDTRDTSLVTPQDTS
eukprot:1161659-Pelagomonas_calceolata.AAC.14